MITSLIVDIISTYTIQVELPDHLPFNEEELRSLAIKRVEDMTTLEIKENGKLANVEVAEIAFDFFGPKWEERIEKTKVI